MLIERKNIVPTENNSEHHPFIDIILYFDCNDQLESRIKKIAIEYDAAFKTRGYCVDENGVIYLSFTIRHLMDAHQFISRMRTVKSISKIEYHCEI